MTRRKFKTTDVLQFPNQEQAAETIAQFNIAGVPERDELLSGDIQECYHIRKSDGKLATWADRAANDVLDLVQAEAASGQVACGRVSTRTGPAWATCPNIGCRTGQRCAQSRNETNGTNH